MKKIILTICLVIASLTICLATANAATDVEGTTRTIIPKPNFLPGPTVKEQQEDSSLKASLGESILPRIGLNLVGYVGAASLLFVIISGVTAYGDEEAVGNAKQQLTYALVGFLLALMAVTIVTIINNINFQGNDTQEISTPAK